MKIEVGLNKQSIKNAINKLNAIKKTVPKMQQEFLEEVAKWIVKQADDYIDNADLGGLVKNELHRGWDFEKTTSGIKILNKANVEKIIDGKKQIVPLAIIVEFGSGVVGQSQAHPNATAEGYEYNVDSGKKDLDGTWRFYTDSEKLVLPQSALNHSCDFSGKRGKGGSAGHRLQVYTRGAKGVWYAFNAIVDANMELAKANGGEIGALWEKAKREYIK
jgi:hypothetical protein